MPFVCYDAPRIEHWRFAWARRCFACSKEVVLGKPTTKFVQFVLKMIAVLQFHNIDVLMVFDGEKLPLKVRRATLHRVI